MPKVPSMSYFPQLGEAVNRMKGRTCPSRVGYLSDLPYLCVINNQFTKLNYYGN